MERKLSDEELNKLMHEKVMEECWHMANEEALSCACDKCGECSCTNPDYLHDPAAYWWLLQKVKGHERWDDFKLNYIDEHEYKSNQDELDAAFDLIDLLLDKQRGCEAIADFFVPDWRD